MNEKIFTYGDYGDNFFIIINGKVSIQVPTMVTMVSTFKEIMKFLVGNFDNVLWSKIENGESLRTSAEYEKQGRIINQSTISQAVSKGIKKII